MNDWTTLGKMFFWTEYRAGINMAASLNSCGRVLAAADIDIFHHLH